MMSRSEIVWWWVGGFVGVSAVALINYEVFEG